MKPAYWLALLGIVIAANVLLGVDRSYAESEARRWRAAYDSLGTVGARIETTYVHRVDTLVRRITRLDTMTRTVEVWKHDTTEVVRYVAQTDSALRACRSVVQTCDERDANKSARILALEGQLRATEAMRPTWRDRVKPIILYGGIGWLAGRAGVP